MLQVTYDLLQGHLRFLFCSPQRSPRLDRCPAQTATAGRAACIHPFLCARLTAARTGKVVEQGQLTFGLLTESTHLRVHCFVLFYFKIRKFIYVYFQYLKTGAKKIYNTNQWV